MLPRGLIQHAEECAASRCCESRHDDSQHLCCAISVAGSGSHAYLNWMSSSG